MATITGTSGNDNLTGTSGGDLIDGGGGIDTINAGDGNDIVRLAGGLPYRNADYASIEGGAGHDVLDLTGWDKMIAVSGGADGSFWAAEQYGWVSPEDYAFTAVAKAYDFEEVWIGPAGGSVSLFASTQGNPNSLPGWKVVTDSGNDGVIDARGNDTIMTGAGNDAVTFHGGSDLVALGDGDDDYHVRQISGYAEHATIDAGAGTDTLEWDDVGLPEGLTIDLAAGAAHASLADFAVTHFENVQLDGNFVWTPDYWQVAITGDDAANSLTAIAVPDRPMVLSGRGGDDYLQVHSEWFSQSPTDASPTFYGGAGNDQISGSDGNDWINGGGAAPGDTLSPAIVNDGADTLRGGSGNDHIYGNAMSSVQGAIDGGDQIFGDGGMDYVNGNAGSDTIQGGEGPDRLYGGSGDDLVYGDGWDSSYGEWGTGNDHINGNKGNDMLHGGSGNDEILGGQGDDLIDGGNGIDTLSGNAGRDIFLFEGHSAAFASTGPDASRTDVITDFHHDEDWIQLSTPVGAVLHLAAAADFTSALALANAALPVADTSRPGLDQDIAAVQVGSDTYIFWDEHGAGPESAARLIGINANTLVATDFIY